jgi:hypothetical protein
LVYDYQVEKWCHHTLEDMVGACVHQGRYVWIDGSGNVWQETPEQYLDDGKSFRHRVTTSWLSFAGLQAYQRVHRFEVLGDWFSAHNLVASIAYDFDPAISQVTTVYSPTDPTVYQHRINLMKHRTTAIQLTLEDNFAGINAPGEGFALSSLTFEVSIKKGMHRLPASSTHSGGPPVAGPEAL